MPAWETTVALLLVAVTIGVAVVFGLRQFRQLRRASTGDSSEQQFLRRTARRRLFVSAMLLVVGIGIGATYLSGLEHSVLAIGDRQGQPPLDAEQKQTVRLYSWSWIAILLVLLGIVMTIGIDLWDVRRHWRKSLQQIRDDRREMLDEQLAKLRAEHRQARVDPELN